MIAANRDAGTRQAPLTQATLNKTHWKVIVDDEKLDRLGAMYKTTKQPVKNEGYYLTKSRVLPYHCHTGPRCALTLQHDLRSHKIRESK